MALKLLYRLTKLSCSFKMCDRGFCPESTLVLPLYRLLWYSCDIADWAMIQRSIICLKYVMDNNLFHRHFIDYFYCWVGLAHIFALTTINLVLFDIHLQCLNYIDSVLLSLFHDMWTGKCQCYTLTDLILIFTSTLCICISVCVFAIVRLLQKLMKLNKYAVLKVGHILNILLDR